MRNKKICLSLLLVVVVQTSTARPHETNSLHQTYTALKSSKTTMAFEFDCGQFSFKLSTNHRTGLSIYIKNDLNWQELDELKIYDLGFTFDAYLRPNPSINDVHDLPEVPLNSIRSRAFRQKYTTRDYLKVIKSPWPTRFFVKIDTKESNMFLENTDPINLSIYLDKEKYLREQTLDHHDDNFYDDINIIAEEAKLNAHVEHLNLYGKKNYSSEQQIKSAKKEVENIKGNLNKLYQERSVWKSEIIAWNKEAKNFVDGFTNTLTSIPRKSYRTQYYCDHSMTN